jgi:hypothetical protein
MVLDDAVDESAGKVLTLDLPRRHEAEEVIVDPFHRVCQASFKINLHTEGCMKLSDPKDKDLDGSVVTPDDEDISRSQPIAVQQGNARPMLREGDLVLRAHVGILHQDADDVKTLSELSSISAQLHVDRSRPPRLL